MIYLLKSFHGLLPLTAQKDIDESMDEEVFDQDLYFKRYEIMTRFLSKQYPDLEETFLDHLVEELYGNLFEEKHEIVFFFTL